MSNEQVNPNFGARDFSRYYSSSFIRYQGQPFYVREVAGNQVYGYLYVNGKSSGTKEVALSELLNWDNLRPEPLGWVDYAGVPLYLRRVPTRQIVKGLNQQNVVVSTVWWWDRVLAEVGVDVDRVAVPRNVRSAMDNEILHCLTKNRNRTAVNIEEQIKKIYDGEILFSVVSREALLCINPHSKSFPIVGFAGELLAAKYSPDSGLVPVNSSGIWEEATRCL